MDIATPIGIVVSFIVVLVAIFLGGSLMMFVDIPSIFIVIGGTISVTFVRYTFSNVLIAIKTGIQIAFGMDKTNLKDLIDEAVELNNINRMKGPVALEAAPIRNVIITKGIQLVIDGYTEPQIQQVLEAERDRTVERMEDGIKIFRSLGDAAPAFGMIGTLVGLVQMLANMDDPSTIGPAMAVALLTTLYGSMIANMVCLPMADKMDSKIASQYLTRTLVLDAVLGIARRSNPDMLRDQLEVYLPPAMRTVGDPGEAKAAA